MAGRACAFPISSHPPKQASPIISAPSWSRPGSRRCASPQRFERANDDYRSILVKALADRIAEAFAERMHERVRQEFWGYAPDEAFLPQDLVKEDYAGIRPAPGYPAQPDHTEKATLFALTEAERRIGVGLTESYAMWPGSSVSGLYLAPSRRRYYFGVAKIERDQVEDYAAAQGHERCRGRALALAGPQLRSRPAIAFRRPNRARYEQRDAFGRSLEGRAPTWRLQLTPR